jgi:hypothetical protein
MNVTDYFYLSLRTASLCATYFVFYYLLSYFFKSKKPNNPHLITSVISVLLVVAISVLVYLISFIIPNPQLSNRIVHMFGGGFLAFLVCFLAAHDSHLQIDRRRLFLLCFMLVTTLGVVNEIAEYFLQTYFHLVSANTATDTWLDLISNTLGILLAGVVFLPFWPPKKDK